MALLGYLLQRCNPVHLDAPLLHALESLLRAVTPSEALTKQLLQQLLLNLRLWSAAPPAGQRSLQDLILKLAKVNSAAAAELLLLLLRPLLVMLLPLLLLLLLLLVLCNIRLPVSANVAQVDVAAHL